MLLGQPLTAKCVDAMKGARKMLMSDYELNPAIVKHCSTVITDYCGGMEKGGKTLHCLMKLGKMPNEHSFNMEETVPKCFQSVSKARYCSQEWIWGHPYLADLT